MKGKVITVCGSLKFYEKIMKEALALEVAENCVLTPVFAPTMDKDVYSQEQLVILGKMHMKKIDMSDAIYVVNIDGYIGEAVKKEIAYAKKLGKEIIYMERIDESA